MRLKDEFTGRNGKVAKDDGRARAAGFVAKAVLLGSIAGAGCAPDINIRNIPFDPNAKDAGCAVKSSCASQAVTLREGGSSAGPNKAAAGNATVMLLELADSGSTKAARIQLSGCGLKADAVFLPGASSVLSLGNESFGVKLESLEYDSAGIVVRVSVSPVCGADGGARAKQGSG